MTKFVYSFNEGSRDMKQLLGIKGANLAEMTGIGLPVPFGFTISTDACKRFFEDNQSLAADIVESVYEKIGEIILSSPRSRIRYSLELGLETAGEL